MEDIKAKLGAMREQLSAAEERQEKTKIHTRAAKERLARAEDIVAAQKRKIRLIELELEKAEDQTDLKLDKLERFHKHIYENETFRQELERKEMKEHDTFVHLESRQKSRKTFADVAEQTYRQACNKLSRLEADVAKADGKIQAAKSKERYFKSKLNDAGRTADSLARSGENKQAKCDEYHEKCRRLNEAKERVLIAAECLERKSCQLENHVVSLRAELRETKKRELKVKRELRDLMDEVNTYP